MDDSEGLPVSGYYLSIIGMVGLVFTLIIGTIVTFVWMTKRAAAAAARGESPASEA